MKTETNSFVRRFWNELIQNYAAILYLIVIAGLACIFVPNFASKLNFMNILKQSAVPAISCVAMTFILVTGNIDLSAGYIVGLVSCVCGIMIKVWEYPPAVAIIICLILGCLLGALNGVLVTVCRIPSFIVTLGTGLVLTGIAQIVSQNTSFHHLPDEFRAFGKTQLFGLTVTVYYALVVAVIAWFVMSRTTFGRHLKVLGLNAAAGRMAGIRNKLSIFITFVIAGGLTAFCSVLLTIRVNCAQPDLGGSNFAFEAITAAVIGGTSLQGGRVNIVCCVAGAIIIKCIESCINILNLNYYLYQTILGVVILIALIVDSMKNKAR